MSYNLRDVQYISAVHTLSNTDYGSGGLYGALAIDISSMVNTQALGGKPVGLAVYRCHIDLSADASGAPVQNGETGSLRVMVTAKDIGTTGDVITGTGLNSLNNNSALNIHGQDWYGPGGAISQSIYTFLEPSDEVPYVVVRDTIYVIWQNGNGALTSDLYLSVRLEVVFSILRKTFCKKLLRRKV